MIPESIVLSVYSLMKVGFIQLVEGLNKTKRLILFSKRRNSFCLTSFNLRHLFFSRFQTQTNTLAFPGSQNLLSFLRPLHTYWNYTIGSLSLPLANGPCRRSWDVSASIMKWDILYNKPINLPIWPISYASSQHILVNNELYI